MKSLLSETPLPNWAKLVILAAALGFQAAIVWTGQQRAVEKLSLAFREKSTIDSLRFYYMDAKLDRRTNQTNIELRAIGERVKYIARTIE
jgi:hypothetical protein